MKTIKELEKVFNKAKGDNKYYTLESFKEDAKRFIKDIKKRETVCSIKVSKSGMSRTFNYAKRYNMLLNICYNQKRSYDPVKVQGCGMDMHWYLQLRTCEEIMTKKELEKYNINALCVSGETL